MRLGALTFLIAVLVLLPLFFTRLWLWARAKRRRLLAGGKITDRTPADRSSSVEQFFFGDPKDLFRTLGFWVTLLLFALTALYVRVVAFP